MQTTELNGIQQVPRQLENNNNKHFNIEVDSNKESFSDMLGKAVNGVDQNMKASEASIQDFVAGKTDNIHDVMISMQQAQLSFQMMTEIRNKAIETYQEISRMQI